MKIAFIGQKGIPVTFGGVEYHVDRLSRELAAMGHDVTVYVRSWYTEKKLKRYDGIGLIHIPTIKSKHLDPALHSFLCSLHSIFIDKPDIIHYHAIGPSFFSLLPRLFRKKVAVTVHRLDWKTEKWGKTAKVLLRMSESISAKIPQRTIVVSEDLQKYFKERHRKDTVCISHGIDILIPRKSRLINDKYKLKGKDYILFMGRLVPEKRVEWLIKSFQRVQTRLSPSKSIKLVIAGGSSSTDQYIQKLTELSKNGPEIIYTGFVTGLEKEELLSNALLFVLPSHLEGLPIALLEAKSYGICCLASDIPPHREAIENGHDGLLFKSEDFNDLAFRLNSLLHDYESIETMGRNAKSKMEKRSSWREIAQQTEKIYREIAGK